MLKRSRFNGLVIALAALVSGGLALFWLFPPWVNAAAPRILPLGLHAVFLADYRAEARVMRLPELSLNLVRDVLPHHGEAALQRLQTPIPTPTLQGPLAQPTGAGGKAPGATATQAMETPRLPSPTPSLPGQNASPSATPTASETIAPSLTPTQPQPTATPTLAVKPSKTPKPTRTPPPVETATPVPTTPPATATVAPYPPPPGSTPEPTASPHPYPAP